MTKICQKRKQHQEAQRPVTRCEAKRIDANTKTAEDASPSLATTPGVEEGNTAVLSAFSSFAKSYDDEIAANIAVNDPSVKDVELVKTPSPAPTPRPFG